MRLTYFEMRKSWLKMPILLLLLLFLVFDCYKISSDFSANDAAIGSQSLVRNSMHGLYQDTLIGAVTEEKIEFIKEKSDKLAQETANFTYSTDYDTSRYTGYDFSILFYLK